jgi:hypothetical protein
MGDSIVDYRWGDKYKPQEFIQRASYEIQEKAKYFSNIHDKFVEEVTAFIRDDFIYPLIAGEPSCDGQFARFRKSMCKYRFKKYVFYMWSFPVETLTLFKAGICVDTAHLACSLLRVKDCNAFTALGEVKRVDNDALLGYHAWCLVDYKGDEYLNETTIHTPGVNTLVLKKDAYDRNSLWARRGNMYYVEHARYNEVDYIDTTELGKSGIIFTLIGKPQTFLGLYGLEKTLSIEPKQAWKQWKRDERFKQRFIFDAWRC